MSETLSAISATVLTTLPLGTEVVLTIPTGVGAGRGFGVAASSVFVQELMRNAPGGFLGLDRSAQIPLFLLAQTGAQVGQALKWNGAAWVPGTVASGGATYTPSAVDFTIAADGTFTMKLQTTFQLTDGGAFVSGDLFDVWSGGSTGGSSKKTIDKVRDWTQSNVQQWTTATRPMVAVGQVMIGYNTTVQQMECGVGAAGGTTWDAMTNADALTVTPSPATTFTATVSPTTVVVGVPVTVTLTPGDGGSATGQVYSFTVSGVAGTFAPTTAIGNGTATITSQFTPSAAGTATINATASNMTLSGTAPSVIVKAAIGTGAAALAMTGASYVDRSDGSGKKMLKSGTGAGTITIPKGDLLVRIKVAMGNAVQDYSAARYIQITQSNGEWVSTGVMGQTAFAEANSGGYQGRDGGTGSYADGAIHEFAMEVTGGNENTYVDGIKTATRYLVGGMADEGICAIDIAGPGTNPARGIFDVRVYSGNLAAPGVLLGEWLLDGSGAAS